MSGAVTTELEDLLETFRSWENSFLSDSMNKAGKSEGQAALLDWSRAKGVRQCADALERVLREERKREDGRH